MLFYVWFGNLNIFFNIICAVPTFSLAPTPISIRQISRTLREDVVVTNIADIKKYMIDIDGTICNTTNSDYVNSIPNYHNIKIFNQLYDAGNEVHYWTARGANSGINWDNFTILQLGLWNVKYTTLNLGKPHYDVWIDDKSLHPDELVTNGLDSLSNYEKCTLNGLDGCEALYYL